MDRSAREFGFLDFILYNNALHVSDFILVQLAGTGEYTDCFSAER